MTDFIFQSADGTTNVILRTDLISAVPSTENLTVCDIYGLPDGDPNNFFANIQKIKYGVGDLVQLAITNSLQLVAQPINKPDSSPTTLQAALLAAPTGFAPTVNSATQITLNWTKTPGATGYVLTRSTSPTFASGNTNFTLGDVATKVDTGLTTATHYYYRIKATKTGATDSAYATGDATTS